MSSITFHCLSLYMNTLSCSAWGLYVDLYQLATPLRQCRNNFFAGIMDGKDVLPFLTFLFFPRDSVATAQMAAEGENDYDGSTDEERENLTQASLSPGKTERIVFGNITDRPITL